MKPGRRRRDGVSEAVGGWVIVTWDGWPWTSQEETLLEYSVYSADI